MKLVSKRRFLEEDQKPTYPFYVEFQDGRRAEAQNPLYLMDLIIDLDFSDIDDVQTMYILGVKKLKDIASYFFALRGEKAIVYDGKGPFFSNAIPSHIDEVDEEMEFSNVQWILDGWDPWTIIASLVKSNYIKLYEKIPVWSEQSKAQGCESCIFNEGSCKIWSSSEAMVIWDKVCPFVTNSSGYSDYHLVIPENIIDGSYKAGWVPISKRTEEYAGYRVQGEE